MIDWREFLADNKIINSFALVWYNGNEKPEPLYFCSFNLRSGKYILEYPCTLRRVCDVSDVAKFCSEFAEEMYEFSNEKEKQHVIESYIKPMIYDNVFYEIENYQTAPFLPKKVDKIQLISERECLEWILNNWDLPWNN